MILELYRSGLSVSQTVQRSGFGEKKVQMVLRAASAMRTRSEGMYLRHRPKIMRGDELVLELPKNGITIRSPYTSLREPF